MNTILKINTTQSLILPQYKFDQNEIQYNPMNE